MKSFGHFNMIYMIITSFALIQQIHSYEEDGGEFPGNHWGSCVCQQSCRGPPDDQPTQIENLKKILKDSMEVLLNKISEVESQLQELAERGYGSNEYKGSVGGRVFRKVSPEGVYKLTFDQGTTLCSQYEAKVATPAQLKTAWTKGMSVCACGWLSDGSARYPIQWTKDGCGGALNDPGVITCPQGQDRVWDVYCFK